MFLEADPFHCSLDVYLVKYILLMKIRSSFELNHFIKPTTHRKTIYHVIFVLYHILQNSRLTALSLVFLRSLLKSSVMRLWRATCPRSSWSFRKTCGCGAPILSPSMCTVSPSGSPSTWRCVCSWVSAYLKRRCAVFSRLSRILWRTFLAFPSTCRLVVIGR